jgi:PleD family two-component response regulator
METANSILMSAITSSDNSHSSQAFPGVSLNSSLIVDDHADSRRLVRMTLEVAGHGTRVCEASGGETGLATAREPRPDVVITDATMPGATHGLSLA